MTACMACVEVVWAEGREHPCAQCLCRSHRTTCVLGILQGQSYSGHEVSPLCGPLASDIDTVHAYVFVCMQVHAVIYTHVGM